MDTSERRTQRRGHLWRSRWAAVGAAVAVSIGAGGVVQLVGAASSTPSSFVTITPVRVLDTRDPVNVGLSGPFVSGVPLDLTMTGAVTTTVGTQVVVPVGATGVAMNVTVVAPSANGFLSIRPADAPGLPTTSNLNVSAGDIVPNAVDVQLPVAGVDAGRIEITFDAYGARGPVTDVLIDVVGYYVTGSAGAAGPSGPAGPAGPAGPTGVAQVTTRTTSFTFLGGSGTGQRLDGNVQCLAGEKVLSGGYDLSNNTDAGDQPNVIVLRSRPALAGGVAPAPGATPTGWYVQARRNSAFAATTVTVYVLCASS